MIQSAKKSRGSLCVIHNHRRSKPTLNSDPRSAVRTAPRGACFESNMLKNSADPHCPVKKQQKHHSSTAESTEVIFSVYFKAWSLQMLRMKHCQNLLYFLGLIVKGSPKLPIAWCPPSGSRWSLCEEPMKILLFPCGS